jgi:hypothetical protein
MGFVSSAHYIIGYANNALEGEDANGKTIMLWNPEFGINENVIDIVGPGGSSGQDNMYMFDCEQLTNGCSVGDELGIKIIDNGDGYTSYAVFVNVTTAGYDFVENITLNSFPEVVLNFPEDHFYSSLEGVDFNCSFFDLDEEGGNLSLFGNFSGNWEEVGRQNIQEESYLFSENFSEGSYSWTCVSEDVLGAETFGKNRSLVVDLSFPKILSFEINDSISCGNTTLNFVCEAEDNFGINRSFLEVTSPIESFNLTMENISGNYNKKVLLDQVGNWTFKCIAEDYAGNINVSNSLDVVSYSGLPELYVNSSKLIFDRQDYIEGEDVSLSAYVENIGCVASSVFNVSFFKEGISFDNQLGENQSLSLNAFSGEFVNLTYLSYIGKNNIFVFLDSGEEIIEHDESNNVENNSFSITLWQKLYGNISAIKTLKTNKEFASWNAKDKIAGNIFVTDKEANVDWLKLKAIGRDILNQKSFGDFSDIDELLETLDLEDSISNIYLEEGKPKKEENFFIYQNNISNVSVVNSTSSGNFVTGILWDTSDDSEDGSFDIVDKEDLVFVTKINKETEGEFGIYDYEISVPVKLRDYYNSDVEEVYLYYDLV